jgi:hypothetical protein
MKLKLADLKKIIKEELSNALDEVSMVSDPRVMQPGEEERAIGAEVPDLSPVEQSVVKAMGGGKTILRQDGSIDYMDTLGRDLPDQEVEQRLRSAGLSPKRILPTDQDAWTLIGL